MVYTFIAYGRVGKLGGGVCLQLGRGLVCACCVYNDVIDFICSVYICSFGKGLGYASGMYIYRIGRDWYIYLVCIYVCLQLWQGVGPWMWCVC